MIIRPEQANDQDAIASIAAAAFAQAAHSSQTEPAIIAALRDAGALTLSLVAVRAGEIVGHIAFSPVMIDGRDVGWHGLGPLAFDLIDRGKASAPPWSARGSTAFGRPRRRGALFWEGRTTTAGLDSGTTMPCATRALRPRIS